MSLSPRLDRLEKNYLINGNLDFWQRGTSFQITTSAGSRYVSDRWHGFIGQTGVNTTFSRQTGGNAPFCIRVQRDSGVTLTPSSILSQTIEINFGRELAGKTVTLQFRARKGANYSPASSFLTSSICHGTGAADANVVTSGFTSQVTANQSNVLTTSFQTFTHTVTLGASATQVGIMLTASWVGTAGAADYFEVEQVMLSVANNLSSAKDFSRAGRNYQEELFLCQRYFSKSYLIDVAPGTSTVTGSVSIHSQVANQPLAVNANFPVEMRAQPAMLGYNPVTGSTSTAIRGFTGEANLTHSLQNNSTRNAYWLQAPAAAIDYYIMHWTADAEI